MGKRRNLRRYVKILEISTYALLLQAFSRCGQRSARSAPRPGGTRYAMPVWSERPPEKDVSVRGRRKKRGQRQRSRSGTAAPARHRPRRLPRPVRCEAKKQARGRFKIAIGGSGQVGSAWGVEPGPDGWRCGSMSTTSSRAGRAGSGLFELLSQSDRAVRVLNPPAERGGCGKGCPASRTSLASPRPVPRARLIGRR